MMLELQHQTNLFDHFVNKLKTLDFDLEIKGNFSSYLGIGIEELHDGACNMTQKGLILRK